VITRLWICGIAPAGPPKGPADHCTGRFMRKICRVAGITTAEYLRSFARTNMYLEPETARHSSTEDANGLAQNLGWQIANDKTTDCHIVFLCGTRVHRAWEWNVHETWEWMKWTNDKGHTLCPRTIPHPSGLCREWNAPVTVERVSNLIHAALARRTLHPVLNLSNLLGSFHALPTVHEEPASVIPQATGKQEGGCH